MKGCKWKDGDSVEGRTTIYIRLRLPLLIFEKYKPVFSDTSHTNFTCLKRVYYLFVCFSFNIRRQCFERVSSSASYTMEEEHPRKHISTFVDLWNNRSLNLKRLGMLGHIAPLYMHGPFSVHSSVTSLPKFWKLIFRQVTVIINVRRYLEKRFM